MGRCKREVVLAQDGPVSLWAVTSAEATLGAPLAGDVAADVAVVGGGYTGLSTALHCAERGLSVRLLEARGIGHGGSGRNVGLVNAGVWHPPDKVIAALGAAQGERFIRCFGAAPGRVFDLIERHQIRCAATRTGTLHAAPTRAGCAGLVARQAAWQRLGAPVRLLGREEMAERTGSGAFAGGLLDARAGTVNPMAYCRGLARAAQGAGAEIHTDTPALALERADTEWVVRTAHGRARARAVVLATNAYADRLWPGLARSFVGIDYFQLATEPLGPRVAHVLPGGQGLWTTGTIMLSLRRDGEGRLILGSMGRVHGTATRGLSQRWAARELARLFPDLGPVRFADAWDGRIALTPDHLPRIHSLAEGLYACSGYNGRGITTGTIFGAALAELLGGTGKAELPLPLVPPRPVRAAPLRARLYGAAFAAHKLLRSL